MKFEGSGHGLEISEISSTGLVQPGHQLLELRFAATVGDDGLEDLFLIAVTELSVLRLNITEETQHPR